jgi:lysophospholipase L1-like esterase
MTATINKDGTKANVINLAAPGYVTYQAMQTGYHVASRPDPDTARNITKALSYKPALVIIAFPTNDIADSYSDDEIMNNYAQMAHVLDSAKVQYIIGGTQPRNFATADQRMRLKTLDDKIISTYTIHVDDSLDDLSNADYSIKSIYSAGDGIHVNNAGHNVIYVATMKQPILGQVLGLK